MNRHRARGYEGLGREGGRDGEREREEETASTYRDGDILYLFLFMPLTILANMAPTDPFSQKIVNAQNKVNTRRPVTLKYVPFLTCN